MDIVQRLREGRTDNEDQRWTVTAEHLAAADEIARLRAENERLRAALNGPILGVENNNQVYICSGYLDRMLREAKTTISTSEQNEPTDAQAEIARLTLSENSREPT